MPRAKSAFLIPALLILLTSRVLAVRISSDRRKFEDSFGGVSLLFQSDVVPSTNQNARISAEGSIEVGGKQYRAGFDTTKNLGFHHYPAAPLKAEDLTELRAELARVQEHVANTYPEAAGIAPPPATRLALKMLEYLSQGFEGARFSGKRKEFTGPAAGGKVVTSSVASDADLGPEIVPDPSVLERNQDSNRNGRKLSSYIDDGAGSSLDNDCFCPGWYRYAYYTESTAQGTIYWRWYRQVKGSSCTGRCGIGCNWFDNDYMMDCFEHDVCLDHLGGSSLGDNPNCGDEFYHAANDYIVTYGAWCPC